MKHSIEAAQAAFMLPGYKDIHEGGSRYIGNYSATSDYDYVVHVGNNVLLTGLNMFLFLDTDKVLSSLGWTSCTNYAQMPLTKRAVWEKVVDGEKVNLIVVFDTAEYNQMIAAARICKWLHKEAGLPVDKEWRAKIHEAARGNFLAVNKGSNIIDNYGY